MKDTSHLKQESPPAGHRKRHTAHGLTSPGGGGGGRYPSLGWGENIGRGGYPRRWGYPSPVLDRGYPGFGCLAGQDWGTLVLQLGLGYPLGQDWVPPERTWDQRLERDLSP